ncbi:MAG: RNase adapter RapZ [Oscillospiraceae bacterium]|nr:RNase adapter RapZ [Oscillospiraceae bacterium]
MEFLIVTGMSGSGKTNVMHFLEDMGYYCVDNLPPQLISKFADICAQTGKNVEKVAIAVDIRVGDLINHISDNLNELKEQGVPLKVLFLDTADDVLLNRYKESRRRHPLDELSNGSLALAISIEREKLAALKEMADYSIDTSALSVANLHSKIAEIFLSSQSDSMMIDLLSFGFKYGIATEADLIFDVRCLPNPYYIPELKKLTGCDSIVSDYVMSFEQSQTLAQKLKDLIDYLIPLYVGEGKSRIVIAFGCTGGKHRSVTFAEYFYKHLSAQYSNVRKNHRDIQK